MSKYIPKSIFEKLSIKDQDKILEAEKNQDIYGQVKRGKASIKQTIKDLLK